MVPFNFSKDSGGEKICEAPFACVDSSLIRKVSDRLAQQRWFSIFTRNWNHASLSNSDHRSSTGASHGTMVPPANEIWLKLGGDKRPRKCLEWLTLQICDCCPTWQLLQKHHYSGSLQSWRLHIQPAHSPRPISDHIKEIDGNSNGGIVNSFTLNCSHLQQHWEHTNDPHDSSIGWQRMSAQIGHWKSCSLQAFTLCCDQVRWWLVETTSNCVYMSGVKHHRCFQQETWPYLVVFSCFFPPPFVLLMVLKWSQTCIIFLVHDLSITCNLTSAAVSGYSLAKSWTVPAAIAINSALKPSKHPTQWSLVYLRSARSRSSHKSQCKPF